MLACRVCCSHRSNRRIRVCISHQSDCRIRVCISHQSYHSIRISCINYSVWVLFSCKWCHGIRGLCTKMTVTSTRQTTYIPSPTTKTMSKVQSEHTQSLHYMNIRQFFTCLNCVLPIKFHCAILDFAPSRVISLTTCILSRILIALLNTTEKNSHEFYVTDSEFSMHSFAFDFFYE